MSLVRLPLLATSSSADPYIHQAVIEWIIAFGFTFYILSFAYDLRLSKGVHKFELSGVERFEPGAHPPAMRQHQYDA